MGSNVAAPPDFVGAARQQADMQNDMLGQQTRANRPDQYTPFASNTFVQGPDGQWTQRLGFSEPMQGVADGLQQQAATAMGSPLDFSGLPTLTNGATARDQAISSAYGQATSRLDPAFAQREEALRSRLANQGLQAGSEAYNREMDMFGRERNDAYGGAMANAISQGTAAGNALFNQSLAGRQQALSELLRQRTQPLSELQSMQGFLAVPGFNATGMGQAPNLVGAGAMSHAAYLDALSRQDQGWADMLGGAGQLLGTAGSLAPFFLSDERAKVDVRPLGEDVLPGVPAITFRYRPEFGLGNALHVGVSAQALQRALPTAVREREDGLLEVHPSFAPHPLE